MLFGEENLPDSIKYKGTYDDTCMFFWNQYCLCKHLNCLPRSGGLDDQDNIIVLAFSVIASEVAEYEQSASKTN